MKKLSLFNKISLSLAMNSHTMIRYAYGLHGGSQKMRFISLTEDLSKFRSHIFPLPPIKYTS